MGEESKTTVEIVVLKIRGSVTEPKSWAARYFADYVVSLVPERYQLDVKFLFELEWIYMKRQLIQEGVQVPGMGAPLCVVWANEKYVGDDTDLLRYLLEDGFISECTLYNMSRVSVQVSTDPIDYCPRNLSMSYVYFNVDIDGEDIGRMLFELYSDVMPESCERFLRESLRYEGCAVHRIVHNGWFESGRLEGEEPPLREKRAPDLSNCREGMLSLVNSGRTNCKSSQFLVTTVPAKHLDPYQCPIGGLLDGINVLEKVNNVETYFDAPLHKVSIVDVTVLYGPRETIEGNHIYISKAVDKLPQVWAEERAMNTKDEDAVGEEKRKMRLELMPQFKQVTSELDEFLNEIRQQLFKENRKLREIVDEPRLRFILKNVLEKEREGGKRLVFDPKDVRKLDVEKEKWYKILVNADSSFDLFYQPTCIPQICDDDKNLIMQKLAAIENPTILALMRYMKKREMSLVRNLIVKIMEQSINAAVQDSRPEPKYIEPAPVDYSRPLGDDIDRLPPELRELLIDEVCELSQTAFDMFRLTLRHILETVSQTQFQEEPSISGDIMMIIMATRSYMSIVPSGTSESNMVERRDSLVQDVNEFSASLDGLHKKLRMDHMRKKRCRDILKKKRQMELEKNRQELVTTVLTPEYQFDGGEM